MKRDRIQRDGNVERDESHISRTIRIERLASGEGDEQKVVYRVSLSSEIPIKDWFWGPPNVLKHSKAAIELSHLGDRGLPFCRDHGAYNIENLLGRIKNLRVDNKRLVGELQWSEANPAAALARAMVDEGTATDMSISAEPIERKLTKDSEGNVTEVEWTRWRPVEASLVAIGADQSVGVGRDSSKRFPSDEDRDRVAPNAKDGGAGAQSRQVNSELKRGHDMDDELENGQDGEDGENGDNGDAANRVSRASQQHDANVVAQIEEKRVKACRKFGEANGVGEDVIQTWIKRGASLDQVADDIEKILKTRGESKASASALDLTPDQTKNYSLARAILAARDENWKQAGFEKECHEEIANRLNKVPDRHTFFVPMEVQQRQHATNIDLAAFAQRHGLNPQQLQRDLTVGTASAGGFTVGTQILGFDQLLRNISVLMRLGVTRLPGLRENVTIPRQTAAATATWLGTEADTITESQQTFTQLPLTPHDVGGYTEISRRLLQQSSIGVEAFVSADLAAVVALAADAAGLSGSGVSGQPTGLDNVSGIGAVTGTSLGFAGVLNFQEDVATSNVLPMSGGYATTPAVASLMIQRVKYTSTASPIWEGNIWSGQMQGFPAMSSNQVAAATMYFGDWAKMVMAEWGTLEIDTNPYAGFTAGIIGIRALYSLDIGVRYPGAFSKASSIT